MPHSLHNSHDESGLHSTESFRNGREYQENHQHDRLVIGQTEEEVQYGSSKNIPRQLHRPHATLDVSPADGNEGYEWHKETGLAAHARDNRKTGTVLNGTPSMEERPNGASPLSTSGLQDNGTEVVDKRPQMENNTIERLPLDANRGQVNGGKEVLRLPPAQLLELASSPKLSAVPVLIGDSSGLHSAASIQSPRKSELQNTGPLEQISMQDSDGRCQSRQRSGSNMAQQSPRQNTAQRSPTPKSIKESNALERPRSASRAVSTHLLRRAKSNSKLGGAAHASIAQPKSNKSVPPPLDLNVTTSNLKPHRVDETLPSPIPSSIPLPPLSIPTYLHLELSSQRPSPLYIHRSATSDIPYESSRVKMERLMNFLLLPPHLELVLWFGALACLDAWLYSFTILPLRFFKALYILSASWGKNIATEARSIGAFIYVGIGRMWRRRQQQPCIPPRENTAEHSSDMDGVEFQTTSSLLPTPSSPQFQFPTLTENPGALHSHLESNRKRHHSTGQKHRKSKSAPSALMPNDKEDILKGLLILISCAILMYFDASMMYHSIRGQAAIKLYVIYNVLEVWAPLLVNPYHKLTSLLGLRPTFIGPRTGRTRMFVFQRNP